VYEVVKLSGGVGTRLSGSQEDYLEAIFELIQDAGSARVRDIADRLDVAKSSVTVALRALARSRLVNYEPYQLVTLSDKGLLAAKRIRHRHQALRGFFVNVLGISEDTADANACRIEHAVSDDVMDRLTCFVEFLADSAVPARDIPSAFAVHCEQGTEDGAGRTT
jgi:DtxR family Mn-dependent transcriptional regulator